MRLGARLQAIASMIPRGALVIDIGADHAKLPIHVVQNGICQQAIIVEVTKGPYESAKNNVLLSGYASKIDVRLGDGLHPIERHEVDQIVMAGMGGMTIFAILTSLYANQLLAQRDHVLLLNPMNAGGFLRYALLQLAYDVEVDQLVQEDGIIYNIMRCRASTRYDTTQRMDIISILEQKFYALSLPEQFNWEWPHDVRHRDPLAKEALARELKKRVQILEKFGKGMEVLPNGLQKIADEIILYRMHNA
nr:hypothetical protein [Bacilli bacterium]